MSRLLAAIAAVGVLLAGLLAATARAAEPARPLDEFKHVSWSIEGGAPSRINSITQSHDGFLWIGSVEGLFRFDGVVFEPITPRDPKLGRMVVSALLAGRDGEVWVGLARGRGVAVFRGGRLADAGMPNPSREVNDLAQDRDGAVWVARGGRSRDTLARYRQGRWQEIGADWNLPNQQIWQLLFARDGTMWVVLSDQILVRRPGVMRFEATGEAATPRASLAEDAEGRIWISDASGTRIATGSPGRASSPTNAYPRAGKVGGVRMLFDREGSLWGTTWNSGVFRIADPGRPLHARPGAALARIATHTAAAGLTSDQAHSLFQDREGNIWIGTELGLDMFRPASVVVEGGIPANSPSSYRMAAAGDGTVYVADAATLYAIAPGGLPRAMAQTASPAEALCAGRDGSVWAPLADRVLNARGASVRSIPKPPGTTAYGCAQDAAGRLWMPALDKGLYVFDQGMWRRIPGPDETRGLPANAAVGPGGQVAVLFRTPPPADMVGGFMPIIRERFAVGGIEGVLSGRSGLFVAGGAGLARIAGGKVQTLSATTYPWLASVNGIAQTDAGDTWTIGDAGIVRVPTAALDRAFERPGAPLPHKLFDFRDGLNSFPQKAPGAQAAVGGDGRVWFLTRRNVVRIDPARLSANTVPPPVLIRSVTAGDRRYHDPARLTLPAGTTSVAIAYTALSLAVPSRVEFRYRLEGHDKGWGRAGTRRSALYTSLGPGRYRFHVIATNNDGVWNRTGATVDLRIPPTLVETWWFRIGLALLAGALIWLGIIWRVRSATAEVEARLSERQAERLRIARELHDTLLQGFQGLLVRFQVVANAIPEGQPAKPLMDAVLDRADEILVEGRDRVRDLRSADDSGSPIAAQLQVIAFQLERDSGVPIDVRFSGAPEPLNVDAQREIVAIAREALTNATRHSGASAIRCELEFSRSRIQLVCSDNGRGIDGAVLRAGGRDGHWGITGMKERARQIGGVLRITSGPTGTQVRLVVRTRVVRPRDPSRRAPWLGRR